MNLLEVLLNHGFNHGARTARVLHRSVGVGLGKACIGLDLGKAGLGEVFLEPFADVVRGGRGFACSGCCSLSGFGLHFLSPCFGGGSLRFNLVQHFGLDGFPGFGGSDEPKEPWDVDGFADFFCRFMEVMQVKQATLIGHSYGGRVIIKLAARESIPFEITNIILIDSAGVLPVRTTAQKWKIRKYKILKKFLNLKLIYAMFPEVIDDWRSRQGSADYRNATPMMRQCMVKAVNEDLTELLPKIRQEVLLIWGDQDTATPIRDAQLRPGSDPGNRSFFFP